MCFKNWGNIKTVSEQTKHNRQNIMSDPKDATLAGRQCGQEEAVQIAYIHTLLFPQSLLKVLRSRAE